MYACMNAESQSFLSYKQSDAARLCIYSGTSSLMVLYIIKAFCFFRRRDSLSQSRVERKWFELVSRGDLVITLAPRFCNFGTYHASNHLNSSRRGCSNQNET